MVPPPPNAVESAREEINRKLEERLEEKRRSRTSGRGGGEERQVDCKVFFKSIMGHVAVILRSNSQVRKGRGRGAESEAGGEGAVSEGTRMTSSTLAIG